MKILFIGPLLDMSGFAHASRNFLKVLLQLPDIEIVARAIKYDQLDAGQKFIPEPWLTTALEKDLLNVNMAIQMTTCNIEAQPVPNVVNGLFTFLESDRMQMSWVAKANEFDFIMLPSKANAEAMLRSGVQKPILVCAPSCDASDYTKTYTPYKIENSAGRTIFYNICQLSHKKGIDSLLRAYYAAFYNKPDEVLLVLKTYVNMQNRQHDLDIVKQYVTQIRQECRIPIQKFPPVLPLLATMSDVEIHGLHSACDAYVCSSRAEGWGVPVFDALAHGKVVISNVGGGLADFVKPENSLIYGGMPTFFFNMPHPDPGLFTGLEQCFEPCIPEMALMMQHYHMLKTGNASGQLNEENQKEWQSILNRQHNASLLKDKFDYHKVALKLLPQIQCIYDSWKISGKVNFNYEGSKEVSEIFS
jgi:hypothetical protein